MSLFRKFIEGDHASLELRHRQGMKNSIVDEGPTLSTIQYVTIALGKSFFESVDLRKNKFCWTLQMGLGSLHQI